MTETAMRGGAFCKESRRLRRWLCQSAPNVRGRTDQDEVATPFRCLAIGHDWRSRIAASRAARSKC